MTLKLQCDQIFQYRDDFDFQLNNFINSTNENQFQNEYTNQKQNQNQIYSTINSIEKTIDKDNNSDDNNDDKYSDNDNEINNDIDENSSDADSDELFATALEIIESHENTEQIIHDESDHDSILEPIGHESDQDDIDNIDLALLPSSIAEYFPRNLMIVSRIISKLVTPHIYSLYEERVVTFVSSPLLNAIKNIKLFYETSSQNIIQSINTSAMCNEV